MTKQLIETLFVIISTVCFTIVIIDISKERVKQIRKKHETIVERFI